MSKILVTGGCGYIGSHTILDLLESGYQVVCLDDLSRTRKWVLHQMEKISRQNIPFYEVDMKDKHALRMVFERERNIEGVIHFAAYKSVPESMKFPLRYFDNNLGSLINLLECMDDHQTPKLVFSSSCTVYGQPDELPVTEQSPIREAESNYGLTKQMCEEIIERWVGPGVSRAVLLRYFNPVGAHAGGQLGQLPLDTAENLAPILSESVSGKRGELVVFGDDYNTRDGSCIRDYIHVSDLAHAHTLALQMMDEWTEPLEIFNLGIGNGVSVLEVIRAFENTTGNKVPYRIGPRRPGDVEAIYADYSKAARMLKWQPERDLDEMMRSQWAWQQYCDAHFKD